MKNEDLIAAIDRLLGLPAVAGTEWSGRVAELSQGVITLLEHAYGKGCSQVKAFNSLVETARYDKNYGIRHMIELVDAANGILRTLKAEIAGGLVGNIRKEVTAEILSDFVVLAQAALDQGNEAGKNVAAVLAAAAFEDTIRRMGEIFCAIHSREDLPAILAALKQRDILKAAQFGTIQAQLQFRNCALHADWKKIDEIGVKTVLLLVQELLLKHFD